MEVNHNILERFEKHLIASEPLNYIVQHGYSKKNKILNKLTLKHLDLDLSKSVRLLFILLGISILFSIIYCWIKFSFMLDVKLPMSYSILFSVISLCVSLLILYNLVLTNIYGLMDKNKFYKYSPNVFIRLNDSKKQINGLIENYINTNNKHSELETKFPLVYDLIYIKKEHIL